MWIKSRGQGVLEYSLLAAVIIASLLLTQIYLKRAMQEDCARPAKYERHPIFSGEYDFEMNTT